MKKRLLLIIGAEPRRKQNPGSNEGQDHRRDRHKTSKARRIQDAGGKAGAHRHRSKHKAEDNATFPQNVFLGRFLGRGPSFLARSLGRRPALGPQPRPFLGFKPFPFVVI